MAADAGTGIVLILHDLTLAMNYADRVIVLKDGNVVADATPESALRPENIADVWGSDVRWVGRKGNERLSFDPIGFLNPFKLLPIHQAIRG